MLFTNLVILAMTSVVSIEILVRIQIIFLNTILFAYIFMYVFPKKFTNYPMKKINIEFSPNSSICLFLSSEFYHNKQ